MEIIIKNYNHYNRALGKYIGSKREYDYEMKSRGFIPYEKGRQLAESKEKVSQWIPSKDCVEMVKATLTMKDSKGNFKPTSQMLNKMKEKKISLEMPKHLPKEFKTEGGFSCT